jgi:hypothetical protein
LGTFELRVLDRKIQLNQTVDEEEHQKAAVQKDGDDGKLVEQCAWF